MNTNGRGPSQSSGTLPEKNGLGEWEREEDEAFGPTIQRLKGWTAPTPTAESQRALLTVLLSAMPAAPESWGAQARRRVETWWPGLLLRAQLRVVRREIWVASALVLALGTLVTLSVYGRAGFSALETLPLVLLAPVVAGLGVACLYGPLADPALEVELAAPVSPRVVLLARLALLFGFDLALGLAGSLALAWLAPGLSLWPLVLSWLAPMAFLSALAFLLAVLAVDAGVSITLCLGLWTVQLLRYYPAWADTLRPLPSLTAAPMQPWLFAGTLALLAVGLIVAERPERWVERLQER